MAPAGDAANFDVIVVGASLTGIIAAQRLLQAHPETRLGILERDYCVGGVWSKRRIYPSFWTQCTHGIAEFSDMPMERPPAEDCMHDLFRAEYTTRYLEDYVDKMGHAGRTLRDRIRFNTEVQSIKNVLDGQWQLVCVDTTSGSQHLVSSSRLMMANGQSSVPNVPNLPGRENFRGQIIHSIDFGQSDVVKDKSIQHVAVIGAGESAADIVYEAAKAGKTVSWIIRKTGNGSLGVAAFAPIDLPTPYSSAPLHAADGRSSSSSSYYELTLPSIMWQNGTAGGCHFADVWPLVAEKVYVHRAGVKLLSEREL
ncbi:hypothetical protein F5Y14DRAFT_417518 [Nemania sp. NC0429]|nr:hypothetical protein F5Y14DRAFT_417518 [Nemania sp. NC0429]